ncbi:unnamed protein product [Boreogadus saida]
MSVSSVRISPLPDGVCSRGALALVAGKVPRGGLWVLLLSCDTSRSHQSSKAYGGKRSKAGVRVAWPASVASKSWSFAWGVENVAQFAWAVGSDV